MIFKPSTGETYFYLHLSFCLFLPPLPARHSLTAARIPPPPRGAGQSAETGSPDSAQALRGGESAAKTQTERRSPQLRQSGS